MDMSWQDFRIQDVSRKRVEACAQFMYCGYEVSFSQIFSSCPVAVFKEGESKPVHECDTVQQAIEWVNAQEQGRRMMAAANNRS